MKDENLSTLFLVFLMFMKLIHKYMIQLQLYPFWMASLPDRCFQPQETSSISSAVQQELITDRTTSFSHYRPAYITWPVLQPIQPNPFPIPKEQIEETRRIVPGKFDVLQVNRVVHPESNNKHQI